MIGEERNDMKIDWILSKDFLPGSNSNRLLLIKNTNNYIQIISSCIFKETNEECEIKEWIYLED